MLARVSGRAEISLTDGDRWSHRGYPGAGSTFLGLLNAVSFAAFFSGFSLFREQAADGNTWTASH
jgi:hypothetical protein